MSSEPGRSLGSKMIRFAVVGLANTAIDLAAFTVLLWLAMPPLTANVGAWLVAVAFSFLANRFWSFERDSSIPLSHSVFRFVSLGALISLGVSSAFIAGLAGWIGIWPAKIAGIIVAAALNFLAARWSIEGRLLR
ncbi:GtrA family protein [Mesorhizobium sp. 1M-11]|uniref:GtrA family protein n=1 Tax=Mesorhizobium sp. 1M-11 TaxID=1529006 RepID=UPI000A446AA5|nr:GtrA family protein [Mesorhizobium sp. 1M-11]